MRPWRVQGNGALLPSPVTLGLRPETAERTAEPKVSEWRRSGLSPFETMTPLRIQSSRFAADSWHQIQFRERSLTAIGTLVSLDCRFSPQSRWASKSSVARKTRSHALARSEPRTLERCAGHRFPFFRPLRHPSIVLAQPDDETIDRLISCFSEPFDNPAKPE